MGIVNPRESIQGVTFDLNTPYKSDYELRTRDTYVGSHNPLGVNYFRFYTPRIPNLSEFVQQVNLPSLSLLQLEQPTIFGVNIPHPSGKYIFEDLTVTFLVDEDMKNWSEIYEWLRSIGSPGVRDSSERIEPEQFHSRGSFTILNSSYKPKFNVDIHNMFPIALSSIQLSTVSTDSEPVFATATFAYSHYEIEKVKLATDIPAISQPVQITTADISPDVFDSNSNETLTVDVELGEDVGEPYSYEYRWYLENDPNLL